VSTSRFLSACRREAVDTTPVWFMRQAGRYMAEYRAIRERYSLLEICRQPDLATEVTLQPVRRIDVDAAIIFSDLLLPLEPMGLPFDFIKGEGPQLERPIGSAEDIDRLRDFDPRESLAHVLDAIRQVQRELAGRVPLIGFAGAPFTLASYAIEGGHSNNFAKTKSLMYGHPEAWHRLCERL
jgi:uroporphyrinogen decarboxylase